MPINSRAKGARGEREWRDELRAQGYLKARRGQQFAGGGDSPDVVCPELEHIHFEVKRTESLNVYKAYEQAERDGTSKTPVVAHKRNNRPWLVVMSAEDFFKLIRSQLPGSGFPNIEPKLGPNGEIVYGKIIKECGCEFGVSHCHKCVIINASEDGQ